MAGVVKGMDVTLKSMNLEKVRLHLISDLTHCVVVWQPHMM